MRNSPEKRLATNWKHQVAYDKPYAAADRLVKSSVFLLGLACFAMAGCKKPAERFTGNEVFGVPARVAAGTINEKLKSVLPPGVQELDLGMSRDEVAKSRARFFKDTGPVVHGLNESTIEMHGYDNKTQTSSFLIDRLELGFSDETEALSEIWARSEFGNPKPETMISLVEGLVEVFGEPTKLAKVRDGRDFIMLWIAGENGSGIKVHLSDAPDFKPTIDFYVQTKHGLSEEDSGLNKWIASAPAEKEANALEFTRKFIQKAFP